MAKRKVSAAQVADVISSARRALKGRDERVLVRVHVDPTCPRELALAVRDALVPQLPTGQVEVRGLGASSSEGVDVALVLVGQADVRALVSLYARSGVSVGLVAECALDVPALDLAPEAEALVGVIAASSAAALPDKLADWMAGATEKGLALAANFPFCRAAVADGLISLAAAENAFIGAVSLIPGSDLPLMCMNQAKLALDLAAAYGEPPADAARVAELLGVVGAGFAYRAVARTLAGALPGLGLLVKASMGYGGTLATGRALRLHLEAGEGLGGRVAEAVSSVAARQAPAEDAPALAEAVPAEYVTIGEVRP